MLQASQTTFDEIQNIVFEFWNGSANTDLSTLSTIDTFIKDTWLLDIHLGTHVFQPNPSGTGISPVFDYRAASRQHDPDAFVLAAPKGNIPAPTGAQDVAWLELTQVQGDLGKEVFRVDTIGGQPPKSVRDFYLAVPGLFDLLMFCVKSVHTWLWPDLRQVFREIL